LSFNTIHDRIRRCETGGLRDGTWLADTLAADAGLDIKTPGFAKQLWESAQQFGCDVQFTPPAESGNNPAPELRC
jgi:hypothetical protein